MKTVYTTPTVKKVGVKPAVGVQTPQKVKGNLLPFYESRKKEPASLLRIA